MNKIEFIKNNFKDYYIDKGPENGILQGTKYAGCATHCRACLNTLVRMIKPKSILEIGSYHYESTVSMSLGMDTYLSSDEGVIHSYDIKEGGYDGWGTTNNLPSRITPRYWYPYKTDYDEWKFTDSKIVHKDFINYTNDELYDINGKILKEIAPKEGYDLIFLDGDHSYEGVKKDWEHAMEVSHKDTLIVIDNIWDIRLKDVRKFYDELKTIKWDFEEWNDEHRTMVQDTGITLIY
jgi:predicted O-methyltransferase YrrM